MPWPRRRRGLTATLAMLYLILFSALALGFYHSVNSAIAIGDNTAAVVNARLAAESGMEFIKVPLSRLAVPHSPDPDEVFLDIYAQLKSRLEGTGNMNGRQVGLSGSIIQIPAGTDQYITLDSVGSKFRVEIEQISQTDLRVRAFGHTPRSKVSRTIRMDYRRRENESAIMDYGIASLSPISMGSNASISGIPTPSVGDMLIVTNVNPALTMSANTSTGGDVNLSNATGTVSTASPTQIKGAVKTGISVPEFPAVDTSAFKPYATTIISGTNPIISTPTLQNLYIKANTNPTFSGLLIQGVVYIETPNKVTFGTNLTIQGVIVQQNEGTGGSSVNQLVFNSNTTLTGVETLPPLPQFPQALREMTGSMILAPNFLVRFDSNFGVSGGTIVAGQLDMNSNTNGVIKGSVICVGTTGFRLDSNANIIIDNTNVGTPAGLYFSSHYIPIPSSYEE